MLFYVACGSLLPLKSDTGYVDAGLEDVVEEMDPDSGEVVYVWPDAGPPDYGPDSGFNEYGGVVKCNICDADVCCCRYTTAPNPYLVQVPCP